MAISATAKSKFRAKIQRLGQDVESLIEAIQDACEEAGVDMEELDNDDNPCAQLDSMHAYLDDAIATLKNI